MVKDYTEFKSEYSFGKGKAFQNAVKQIDEYLAEPTVSNHRLINYFPKFYLFFLLIFPFRDSTAMHFWILTISSLQ